MKQNTYVTSLNLFYKKNCLRLKQFYNRINKRYVLYLF